MATDNKFKAYKFARSLSELSSASQFLDPNSFIEIEYQNDDTGKNHSSKTTLGAIDQAVITSFDLYNNLNNIFNPLEHPNDTYFGTLTTFFAKNNPFVHKENNKPNSDENTLFDSLRDNNLVTKQAVDDYLKDTGIALPVCSPDANYVYYVPNEHLWKSDNSKKPIVMDYHKDGIWTSESKLKFHYGTNYYYFTDEVVAPKNIMLNVTGNIVLNSKATDYNNDWFERQHYFAGLTLNGKIVTFTFLKNILKIENTTKVGEFYIVAQFHFVCPLAKGTTFRIITNANCRLFGIPEKDQYSRKLYDSLNAVNLCYYDYYGNDITVNYVEKSESGLPSEPYVPPVEPTPVIPPFTKEKTFTITKEWVGDEDLGIRPDEISAELKVANKTIVKMELNELTDPPWTGSVTMRMPETMDIDAEWDEISGHGISSYTSTITSELVEGGKNTTVTNTFIAPVLYFNPNPANLGNLEEGETQIFTNHNLYCYRLRGPVHVELRDNDDNIFSLMQSDFEPDESGSVANVPIPIKFTAPAVADGTREQFSCTIVLSSYLARDFVSTVNGYSYSNKMRTKSAPSFSLKARQPREEIDGHNFVNCTWELNPNYITGDDIQAWNACLYINNTTSGGGLDHPADLTVVSSGTFKNNKMLPTTIQENQPFRAEYDYDLYPTATFYTKLLTQNYGSPKPIGTIIPQSRVIS